MREPFYDRATSVGASLARNIKNVIDAIPGKPASVGTLSRMLGVDKMLSSRTLKAVGSEDPLAVLCRIPGPGPLRRFLISAKKKQVPEQLITTAAQSIEQFENMLRQEVGDRSALDAIISTWLPESRREFELRRKQSAYRAMSQLLGVSVKTNFGAIAWHPSEDNEHLDVLCLMGLQGLRRLRPGATVKLSTRFIGKRSERHGPETLDRKPITDPGDLLITRFCSSPPPPLDMQTHDGVVRYVLGQAEFDPHASWDLVFCETNSASIKRYEPLGGTQKRVMGNAAGTPAKTLIFDGLVHRDVCPGAEPELLLYNTMLEGFVDPNDPAREVDRLDMIETIQPMGWGIDNLRTSNIPNYQEMLQYAFAKRGIEHTDFRCYRLRIEYPILGCQAGMGFRPPLQLTDPQERVSSKETV